MLPGETRAQERHLRSWARVFPFWRPRERRLPGVPAVAWREPVATDSESFPGYPLKPQDYLVSEGIATAREGYDPAPEPPSL